ncbi:hypothetical protein [Ruegeria sp.]|uniref:hypothetical protein n=1 Tax=Ruegeria sp. TaxID=1879320 RepID=UPI003B008BBF
MSRAILQTRMRQIPHGLRDDRLQGTLHDTRTCAAEIAHIAQSFKNRSAAENPLDPSRPAVPAVILRLTRYAEDRHNRFLLCCFCQLQCGGRPGHDGGLAAPQFDAGGSHA